MSIQFVLQANLQHGGVPHCPPTHAQYSLPLGAHTVREYLLGLAPQLASAFATLDVDEVCRLCLEAHGAFEQHQRADIFKACWIELVLKVANFLRNEPIEAFRKRIPPTAQRSDTQRVIGQVAQIAVHVDQILQIARSQQQSGEGQ
jgi:hypothetical protein